MNCDQCERMAAAETKISDLKGDVSCLSAKLDKLIWGMLATTISAVGTLIILLYKGVPH